MVSKIINFLNREVGGLHKAAFLLGFFALSSQMLALVRDRLLAHIFGAGIELDIYYAAFRIPDFIFITVGSLVSVSIIVPFLVERLTEGKERGKEFIDQIFSCFVLIIALVAVVTFLLTPVLVEWLFGDFALEKRGELITLTRLLLASPILLGVSGLLGSVSQAYKRFFLYALSPVLYNLGIIVGILTLAPHMGILGVGVGVLIGAGLHLGVHIPFVWSKGLWPGFSPVFKWSVIKEVVINSLPRALTLAMTHIILFVLVIMATNMAAGSVSVFQLAHNLQSVPLSIIGVSYSLAALPTLAVMFAKDRRQDFLRHVSTSARHIIFWSVPVIVLFVVLRAQIVRVILGTGQFDWTSTQLTAAGLGLFSVSVVFEGLVLLFVRAFYAMRKTAIPFVISGAGAVLAVGSAFGLQYWYTASADFRQLILGLLRLESVETGAEVVLLALAFSIGVFAKAVILWLVFEYHFSGFTGTVIRSVVQVLIASGVIGVVTYSVSNIYAYLLPNIQYTALVFIQGAVAGLAGVIVGAAVLFMLKNKEIRAIVNTVKQRFWKSRVIGPDPDLV